MAGQVSNQLNRHGQSPIREEWRAIRRALERNKISTPNSSAELTGEISQDTIKLNYHGVQNGDAVPVLVAITYHPNWHRRDGGTVYAATPFSSLASL